MVDLLSEDAAHHRPTVLERDRRMVRNSSSSASSSGETRVAVAHELADLPALPAQGEPHVVRTCATFGPGDLSVLQHERRPGRVKRLHRRLHDRLERLLEVERLRDRLRDARERLELRNAPLRALVELRVLDCLRNLRRDGDEELDLGVGERTRVARADVQRSFERVASENRHGEDGLVLVLREVGESLEARVEVRLRGDHHRRALGRRDTGNPFAGTHAWRARELLDARAVGRAQDELVGTLVVEIDEARIGAERVGDLARDELEHLLEVERRVDRRDRLGQESQVPSRCIHEAHCPTIGRT